MKKMANDTKTSDKDKVALTRKVQMTYTQRLIIGQYLLIIGDKITAVVEREKKLPRPTLEEHLWSYASSFTAYDESLKRLYKLLSEARNK